MENTTEENVKKQEDEIFLDVKNRKKFEEKTICQIDDEECLSCGS